MEQLGSLFKDLRCDLAGSSVKVVAKMASTWTNLAAIGVQDGESVLNLASFWIDLSSIVSGFAGLTGELCENRQSLKTNESIVIYVYFRIPGGSCSRVSSYVTRSCSQFLLSWTILD